MSNLISLILGSLFTIIAGWFFYAKSKYKNSLTPYLDYFSIVFKSLNPELRKELLIEYKGEQIDYLYEVQFTIKNTGNKALTDLIEPLSLKIDELFEIIDYSIVKIRPVGRKVTCDAPHNRNHLRFDFSLLNPNDYFTIKLLLRGDLSRVKIKFPIKTISIEEFEDIFIFIAPFFEFQIIAPDLLPQLQIKERIWEVNNDMKVTLPKPFVGIQFIIFSIVLSGVLTIISHSNKDYSLVNMVSIIFGISHHKPLDFDFFMVAVAWFFVYWGIMFFIIYSLPYLASKTISFFNSND